jgi:hypothetical protein
MSGNIPLPHPAMSGRRILRSVPGLSGWAFAAGDQPRKGEEQDYDEHFRHCSI